MTHLLDSCLPTGCLQCRYPRSIYSECLMKIFNFSRSPNLTQLSRSCRRSRLREAISTIGHFLELVFTKQPELQIRVHTDPSGQTWWQTRNLMTWETRRFRSHSEMLEWIHDRYLKV
jgi:hypothetical protein